MTDKKIKSFLRRSFFIMIIICTVVFAWMIYYMGKKTEKSIVEVSEIYLSEMNLQLQQKFSSIIALRINQVEGIIMLTPPEETIYGDEMLEELRTSVAVRGFSYLGFYTEDGELETIYGNDVEISNNSDIVNSLHQDGNIIARGVYENGDKVLLLGKQASYPMRNGEKSSALVAGISMEYLNQALYLYSDDAMVYSHLIDDDGTFIIKNGDAYRDSYFERIKEEFDELHGKDADRYTQELKNAISKGETYSTLISVNGEQRHIYCAPISENSSWYLITVMPNGVLKKCITELDNVRIAIVIGSSLILLLAMSVVFFMYYRLSRGQMKELDKAKQEADRANKAKSEFLSSMSHDIRTPLNAVIGMTEIALKNIDDSARVEDCLTKVKLSGKHLLGLINDVLDMSKIESGKLSFNICPLSLKETMSDIVNIMQPQVKAREQYFDIFIQGIISENVCCDSVRLNQVLLNLLSNAVKFTPERGKIDVYLYQEPSPRGDEYVRTHFRVEDTGIGMSREFQEKIFDTFARENTEQVQNINGTGLGMSITKCIVDIMEGTIQVESEQGKGSKFHVILDLKKAETNEEEMKLPEWNVLVVDDNEQLCSSAVSNLEELGVHADWTLDGRKAVQMVEEHHEKKDDYHFVLIDWKMPHMDGIQTIREIRNRIGDEIPVFLISAYDFSDIEEEAHSAGIEGFISKPLFKSTLYSSLKQYAKESDNELRQKESSQFDFSGKHVLIAEDIDLNWEIAEEILSSFGFILDRAANGQECVEIFKNSEVGYYDAVLMDIRMPVMNGYDATKAIRALDRPDKELPIIAMTADAFSDDARQCFDSGMNAHLAKPLDIKECMRTLEKYIK